MVQHGRGTMTSRLDATIGAREAAHRISDARARRAALRVVGGGSWLDAGAPCRTTETISLAGHAEIVEYVPGDFTLTARAGTTLGQIADATRAHGQWLPLDPAGSDAGTIGATVATASSGSLAAGFGQPRDMVLGLEAVTGRGAVIRGGGRVVKNVAGFDLVRMIVGSWGSLAVITEVTVRLRAMPEIDETIAIAIDDSSEAVRTLQSTVNSWPFTPIAAELLDATSARALGIDAARGAVALFRIAGNEDAVRAQRGSVARLGSLASASADAWTRFRALDQGRRVVFRISAVPSRLHETWDASANVAAARTASITRGVVRCFADAAPSGEIAGFNLVAERFPGGAWPIARVRNTTLERRMKSAFDPDGVLNAGIMGIEP